MKKVLLFMVLICYGISSQAQNDSIAKIDQYIKDQYSALCKNDCIYLLGNFSNDTNYINQWFFKEYGVDTIYFQQQSSCSDYRFEDQGGGNIYYLVEDKRTSKITVDSFQVHVIDVPYLMNDFYEFKIDDGDYVLLSDVFNYSGAGLFTGNGIVDAFNGTFSPSSAGVGVHEIVFMESDHCHFYDTIIITVTDTAKLECSKQLGSYEFYGDFRMGMNTSAQFSFINLSGSTMYDVESYVVWDDFIPISSAYSSNGILNQSYADSLVVNADSLKSGDKIVLTILYDVPVDVNELGRDICFKSNVWNSCYQPSDMDTNLRGYCSPLRAPYDPNHKEATIGDGPMDTSTTQLTYDIQFQNLGNDTAFTVVIEDTINPNHFDINSITMIGSSDPYTMTKVVNSNLVRWEFKDIKLVDSLTNEPESHGSLRFSIDLKSGIQIGEKVNNTAHIYFDHNPAITTNTTENYFVAPINTNTIKTVSSLKAYPINAGEIQVELNALNNNEGFYSLTEIGGKVFSQQKLLIQKGKNNFQITTGNLAAGIYILKINEVSTQIMIK